MWRVDNANAWIENRHSWPAKKRLSDYFRENFYVTTSGNFHTPALRTCTHNSTAASAAAETRRSEGFWPQIRVYCPKKDLISASTSLVTLSYIAVRMIRQRPDRLNNDEGVQFFSYGCKDLQCLRATGPHPHDWRSESVDTFRLYPVGVVIVGRV